MKKGFFRAGLVLTGAVAALWAQKDIKDYELSVYKNAFLNELSIQQDLTLSGAISTLNANLKNDEDNLLFLSTLTTNYLQNGQDLTPVFRNFAVNHLDHYNQVRYIDNSGYERVRINVNSNGNVRIVSKFELQDKSNRYYFTDTKKLNVGEVYVSKFDNNVESGRPETVIDPTYRVFTPVYFNSLFQGVVGFNVIGNKILNQLKERGVRIINSDLEEFEGDGFNKLIKHNSLSELISDTSNSLSKMQVFFPRSGLEWRLINSVSLDELNSNLKQRDRNLSFLYFGFIGFTFFGVGSYLLYEYKKKSSRVLEELNFELEKANNAKAIFLACITHELRSPLNGILGFCGLIKDQIKNIPEERIISYLDNIESSGEHLLGLVNDIIDMGTLEAGRMKFGKELYYVAYIFDEVEKMMESDLSNKGLTFEKRINGTLKPNFSDLEQILLLGDRQKVKQTIINLVSNSVKYSEGSIVGVDCFVDEQKDYFKIVVYDDGKGISEEEQETVLMPFGRGLSDSNKSGTGLGLPISKAFIEGQGGIFDLESRLGDEVKFTIRLPLTE